MAVTVNECWEVRTTEYETKPAPGRSPSLLAGSLVPPMALGLVEPGLVGARQLTSPPCFAVAWVGWGLAQARSGYAPFFNIAAIGSSEEP